MDWREYEQVIFEHLQQELPAAELLKDVQLSGALSGTSRQIDVLVREEVQGQVVATAVDAKHHKRPIDVKHVESFLGLLRDIDVQRGIMISEAGYTSAAYQRAFADDVDLDLDIFSLAEFKQWQAALGIPYSGSQGVILPPPLGWVVDITRRADALAWLYQRGLSFDEAWKRKECMYVSISHRRPPVESLDELLEFQAKRVLKAVEDGKITSVTFPQLRTDARCAIRHFEAPHYPTVEITGFVEFSQFVFFVVLFTPLVVQRRDVRKLEQLMRRVLPIKVTHSRGE